MIASYVSMLLTSEAKEPEIWDFYPELFNEERQQIEQTRIQKELEIHKANMRAFAERMKGRFQTEGR